MKQKPSGKLTATILSISLLTVMAGAAIAPALGVISAHFSNCSQLIIGSAVIGLANGLAVPYLNTIASIKGGKNAATTVMPLISAALYHRLSSPHCRLFDKEINNSSRRS